MGLYEDILFRASHKEYKGHTILEIPIGASQSKGYCRLFLRKSPPKPKFPISHQ